MATRFTGLGVAVSTGAYASAATRYPPIYLAQDAAGTGAADMVIYIADLDGRIMGELDGVLEGVAWKLNDYGQARITLPRGEATVTERMLNPGNRMLIQFNNGLPDWGGILDLPRKWKDGRVEVVGYSAERILVDRVTGKARYFNNAYAGDIFRALINEAAPMGVEVGDVWIGGELHSPDYHYRGLYDIFTKSLSQRIEDADWDVTTRLDGGRITFYANYYERKGRDHGQTLALLEGVNLSGFEMQEQGPIVNQWLLAGAGTGWRDDNRIYSSRSDTTSEAKYGLRQRGEVRVDVSRQQTLNKSAGVLLAESKEPHSVVSPMALDFPPARFGQYGVGDSVWMELYDTGFDNYGASVRIRAREYLPGRGVCSLVIE